MTEEENSRHLPFKTSVCRIILHESLGRSSVRGENSAGWHPWRSFEQLHSRNSNHEN